MTINIADNSPRISYSVADGVTQTSFTVPFEFFDDEDLNVYVDGVEKTLTSDYTVSGGDGSTGTVTISVTGGSGGSTVVITRDIALERTTDFPVSGAFNIVALNTELDRLVAVAADLDDRASRALQLTDYDVSVGLTLPVVDTRKGKTLAFNETTGAVEAGPSIADTQSVANASADIALLADIQDGTIDTNALTNLNSIRTNVTTVSGISSDVTTVSANNANVTTVAANDADITTVAGSISNVNAVGNAITNVNTTATNIANVNTVASEIGVSGVVTIVANAITDVSTVSDDIAAVITAANDLNEAVSEIDTVANAIANVDTVGTNIASVNTVAGISADVTTVAADGTDIGTVATNISNVNTVAGISSNVTTVAGISSAVTTVAADGTDIGVVSTNIADVNTVAGISGNVSTVAGISANVTTVAGISSDVTTVAADTADIGTIATNLNGSDTIGTVATNITNVNNVGGAIADVTTVASNLTDVQSFANTYRIGTTEPTTSLDTGDLFFNTSTGVLKVYNGSAWEAGVTAGSGFLPLTGGTMTGALDVQSTITSDGLTVYNGTSDPDVLFRNNGTGDVTLTFRRGAADDVYTDWSLINDSGTFKFISDNSLDPDHTQLTMSQGDISFYEDTGTTAKFFWDASAESLGIGTSSPATSLHILPPSGNFSTTSSDFSGVNLYLEGNGTAGNGSFGNGIAWGDVNGGSTKQVGISSVQTGSDVNQMGLAFFTHPSLTGSDPLVEAMRIDSSGNVGIGTSSPFDVFHVRVGTDKNLYFTDASGETGNVATIQGINNTGSALASVGIRASDIRFANQSSEAMRIDSSGNLLVGTTDTNHVSKSTESGFNYNVGSWMGVSRDSGVPAYFNRNTSDGAIAVFRKDGTTVGSIGSHNADSIYIGTGDTGLRFNAGGDAIYPYNTSTNASRDNAITLGSSALRFKDLYLAGGVVETTTTVSYAASIALTYDNGSVQTVTLTGNVEFTDSLADGEAIVLMLNGGASYTVLWTAVDKWVTSSGNAAPTLTANDTVVLWKIGTTVYAAYAGSYT
jgi:hypothetical protein